MQTATATVGSGLEWAVFLALVGALLALDLGLLHPLRQRRHRLRAILLWNAFWTAVALLFNVWVLLRHGRQMGLEFFAGYLVERSLSFDNLLVFLLLFEYFAVPRRQQRRVLFWGILGSLAGRGALIAAGTLLLARWAWVLQALGVFLIYAGARMAARRAVAVEPGNNPIFRLFRRFVPLADGYRHNRFLVREQGRLLATPLLLVLAVVEATDLAFAVDSVPAVFGVSQHAFIVFTSNILAVLGLRALYFLVAELMQRLRWLTAGLGLVLVFVGAKMALSPWIAVPIDVTLAVVGLLLAAAVAASLALPRRA